MSDQAPDITYLRHLTWIVSYLLKDWTGGDA